MAIDPLFGIELTAEQITNNVPLSVLYGVTPNNKFIPVRMDTLGRLELAAVTLEIGDLQIGAVEIKNATTDDRAVVSTDGEVRTEARLHDGTGIELTSTLISGDRALDVNVVGFGGGVLPEADDDDIAPNLIRPTNINLLYGFDGTTRWERLNQTGGSLDVDVTGSVLPTGAASETTQALLLTEATFAAEDFATEATQTLLLTEATFNAEDFASETTLAGIKSQTDQFSFTGSSLNVSIVGGGRNTVDDPTDLYISGVTSGIVPATRVISSTPTLVAGQFSSTTLTTAGRLIIDGSQVTQPISAASLPLPTGAATESTVASIDTKLTDGSQITRLGDGVGFISTRITPGANSLDVSALNFGFNGTTWETVNSTSNALNVNFANSTFNIVSTLNSTTTPLGVSGIFTGTFEDILKYGHLTLLIATDAADSIVDGLEIQWSSDGVTVDDTDKFTIGANVDKIYTFGPQSKFFRIKYTNNTAAQTTFTIQTVLKQFNQKSSSHRIGELISSEDDAELVKSVLSAKDVNTGLWQNIESVDGRLCVDATIVPSATSPVTTMHEAVVKDDAFLVKLLSFNLGSAGVEGPIMLIRNPGGSGSTLYVHTLGTNNEVKTQTAKINIYKLPVVTATGAVEIVENQLVGSATASVMSVFSSPTISANGSLLYSFATGANQNDLRRNFEFGAALPPGFDYLITGIGSNNNTLIDLSFEWAEV